MSEEEREELLHRLDELEVRIFMRLDALQAQINYLYQRADLTTQSLENMSRKVLYEPQS